MKFFKLCLFLCVILSSTAVSAQPAEQQYKVAVYPASGEWNTVPSKDVTFNILVTKCNVPVDGVEVRYEVSQDMMSPVKKGTVKLKNGQASVKGGTMKTPGFLRCRVFMKENGRNYEGKATVGFSPEKLEPVTIQPADFKQFWDSTITKARKWPLEPVMTLVPEKCTDKVNVYHVSFANNDWGSRIYGMLCVPKAEGKYPAILRIPGAGIRAYYGEIERASKGFIILEIGIHGIPVNLPSEVYNRLYRGGLKDYYSFNLDDRERFYYKRVITGCVRAIDFIEQLPQFNGCLATFGSSQGGGLSIITAGIDPRVNALVSYYPALSDMAGYTKGRAGGWPHTLKDKKYHKPEIINTIAYFDAASFAREIKVPGFYTFGYNDMVCPPTTTYSVYNVINAPKELMITETTEHYAYAEQHAATWKWVMDFLRKCSNSAK